MKVAHIRLWPETVKAIKECKRELLSKRLSLSFLANDIIKDYCNREMAVRTPELKRTPGSQDK